MTALDRWWFPAVPLRRVALFRVLVYLFIPVDVLVTTAWVSLHAYLPRALYRPLAVGRLLHLPAPTYGYVVGLKWALVVAAVAAAIGAVTGRTPRLLGALVFLLYADWMIVAMSYGKVDHDRFAFLVALAVLPTVGRDVGRGAEQAAGWALRAVQVAVIATYPLSAWSKFRFGGLDWLNSAVLVGAVVRRGTVLGTPLLHVPELLRLTQWGIVAFELLSPVVLFLRPRWQYAAVAGFVVFHLVTFATIGIIFLPHVVCLAAFLPLERLRLQAGVSRPSIPARAAPGSPTAAAEGPWSAPRPA